MSIKKHIGKVVSTDQRCVVVFMRLPDAEDKALIINTESLQPYYEQILMEVVNSPEGQQAGNLADVLSRRMVQQTGRTILEEFHNRGLMRAELVSNIVMLPRPNMPMPLADILAAMDPESAETAPTQNYNKFNPIANNISAASSEERLQMAHNLIVEAEMLEAEAAKKREIAYAAVPTLRPVADTPIVPVADDAPAQATGNE